MSIGSNSDGMRSLVAPVLVMVGAVVITVLVLSGIPGGPTPTPGVVPTPVPLSASTITCNNARVGGLFQLTVHARPQVGVWVLASGNGGPTTIGPWQVDLGHDWFLLQDFAWTSGGNRIDIQIPLPPGHGWAGTEALGKALVHDPNSWEWAWTETVLHRFSHAPQGGRSVCLVRQVSATGSVDPHCV